MPLNSISEKAKLILWYIIIHNIKLFYSLPHQTKKNEIYIQNTPDVLISLVLACEMFCIPFTGFTLETMLLKIFQVSIKITCRIYSTQLFYCLHAYTHTQQGSCLSGSYACRGWLVSAPHCKVGQKPFEDTERKRTKEWVCEREGASKRVRNEKNANECED